MTLKAVIKFLASLIDFLWHRCGLRLAERFGRFREHGADGQSRTHHTARFCRKSRTKDLAPSLRNFLTVALNCLTVSSLKSRNSNDADLFVGRSKLASDSVNRDFLPFHRESRLFAAALNGDGHSGTDFYREFWQLPCLTVCLETSLPLTLSSTSPTCMPAFGGRIR